MIKSALIEAKKLLDFYIKSTDDLDVEQTESVKHFIKALKAGCGCDYYNGFDCGCGKRAFLCDEALKELDASTCLQRSADRRSAELKNKIMNWIQKLFKSRKVDEPTNSALNISAVMPSLSSLTDEDFYMYLEEGKIYLQHYHNPNMDEFFKEIKWFWKKDTAFLKRGEAEKKEAANKTYKNVKEWVKYCGGRNSGLWIPNWA